MREDLVGYLLNALEPAEKTALEAELARNAALAQDLEVLRRSLSVLDDDRASYDPPAGLADRTCGFVWAQATTMLAPAPTSSRWRMADFVVAAGIFLAASLLFFPAISQSRYAARLQGCQNNLRQLGHALAEYSGFHGGQFPDLEPRGRQSTAGIYAAKLYDQHLLDDPSLVICPASSLAEQARKLHVPTLAELESASPEELAELHRLMGGSYGYSLGYMDHGDYQPTKNLRRKSFAIMADAPSGDLAHPHSPNHGNGGQNVLFEDGHVSHLLDCNAEGCPDHIYLNEDGQMAAGLHKNDAVIGSSHVHPLPELPLNNDR